MIEHIENAVIKINMIRYVALALASQQRMDIAKSVASKTNKNMQFQLELVGKKLDPNALRDRIEKHKFTKAERSSKNIVSWQQDFFTLMQQSTDTFRNMQSFSGKYNWIGISPNK